MRLELACLVGVVAAPATARAELWVDATAETIGATGGWTNKVTLADLDLDRDPDILFANGGNYATAGTPEQSKVFRNDGGTFVDISDTVFGDTVGLARVIKVADVDANLSPDIFVAGAYGTQSKLYRQMPGGVFVEEDVGPVGSIADAELGDIDGDGDLDLVLVDWTPTTADGLVRIWLNDDFTGVFEEFEPLETVVGWSWDLELVDVDNDWDLDILVSSKSGPSRLFVNDGDLRFDDGALPETSNNYDFEAMDLNGDGWLDLVTINDGPMLREHVFLGGEAGFTDATDLLWPDAANAGEDDNVVVFLDHDSDQDADFLIGSLSGDDRLLVNDGLGNLSLDAMVIDAPFSAGTLGLAAADLDGDARLDLVMAQGELDFEERVSLGMDIEPDTAAPLVATEARRGAPPDFEGLVMVHARVTDGKSAAPGADLARVWLRVDGTDADEMLWYGEHLWRQGAAAMPGAAVEVCARDVAGNETCAVAMEVPTAGDAGPTSSDAGAPVDGGGGDGGCGCQAGGATATGGGGLAGVLLLAVLARRRKR